MFVICNFCGTGKCGIDCDFPIFPFVGKEKGLLKAKSAAMELAQAEAAEKARLEAERLAREAAAWSAEAGANAQTQRK